MNLNRINQGTDREKEKDPHMRSFDNRTQSSSRTASAHTNAANKNPVRNASVEKMRYDSLSNQQRLSEEAKIMSSTTGLTRKKGSQSNLRGSATSNFAITRKASHSQLQKYKF